MKKIKNRIFLFSGTLLAIGAPIATVVSCNDVYVSPEAIRQRELWMSSQSLIEQSYQETLINELSKVNPDEFGLFGDYKWATIKNNSKIMDFLKNYVIMNVYDDNKYISKLGDLLLATTKSNNPAERFTEREIITEMHMKDFYFKNLDISEKNSSSEYKNEFLKSVNFDKAFETIWDKNINHFKNLFYKKIISTYYLNVNKSHWQDVFTIPAKSNVQLSSLETYLNEDNFVLERFLIKTKSSFDWKISLDENISKAFSGKEMTESELNTAMTENGAIAKVATKSQTRSLLPNFLISQNIPSSNNTKSFWEILNNNKNIIGFSGINSRTNMAENEDKIKQVIDSDKYDEFYYGYFNNDESKQLVGKTINDTTEKIKLTSPKNEKVEIVKALMIMPLYADKKNGSGKELSIDFFKDGDGKFATLKRLVIKMQESDIYSEAIRYYVSKYNSEFGEKDANGKVINEKGGIRLNILNDSLRKIAINTFALPYVNKP